jgi:hypothetical protein
MGKFRVGLALVFILSMLSACGVFYPSESDSTSGVRELDFWAKIAVDREEKVSIEFGVNLSSGIGVSGKRFKAVWVLEDSDGSVRSQGDLYDLMLPEDPPSQTPKKLIVSSANLSLDPGQYQLRWGSEELGFLRVIFDVVEREGVLIIGQETHSYEPAQDG